MRIVLLASVATLVFAVPASANPTIILNDNGGVPAGSPARAAVEAAAVLWSAALASNVTVRIDVSLDPLPSSFLAETSVYSVSLDYTAVRGALLTRAASSAQKSASGTLGSSLSFMSNITPGVGVSLSTHYFDQNTTADNKTLVVSTANAKALGMYADNGGRDGWISLNDRTKWDYNSADGTGVGLYDLVGVAAHEMGHVLGFESGVDSADSWIGNAGWGQDQNAWGTPLDLFRYQKGQRDWTVGGTPCLSIDAGKTCAALMSTGTYYGDHHSASHWKGGLHLGLMDPVAVAGHSLAIGPNDLLALNVIGWGLPGAAASAAHAPTIIWTSLPRGPRPAGNPATSSRLRSAKRGWTVAN